MRNNEVRPIFNPALITLISNPTQMLTIDANFLIPSDRSSLGEHAKALDFDSFKVIWLDPLIYTFPGVTIHEAVYEEIIQTRVVAEYIDRLLSNTPPQLIKLSDNVFTDTQVVFRETVERAIARNTNYDPVIDNKRDRGEVKSLAHIATIGLLYFCSHDSNAIRLIEDAKRLHTYLDNIGAIKTYEVIYCMFKFKTAKPEGLRNLYRYLYRYTKAEAAVNPKWSDFLDTMDLLYSQAVTNSPQKPKPVF